MKERILDMLIFLHKDTVVDENIGDDVPLLHEIIYSFNGRRTPSVLELGTGRGGSLIPMAIACKHLGGRVATVDISTNEYGDAKKRCEIYDVSHCVNFIHGDDNEESVKKEILKHAPFDFIFMDTSKKREHTVYELNTFSKHLTSGGFIALHDTNETIQKNRKYGVRDGVMDFLAKNKDFIKIFDTKTKYGLIVLKNIGEISDNT